MKTKWGTHGTDKNCQTNDNCQSFVFVLILLLCNLRFQCEYLWSAIIRCQRHRLVSYERQFFANGYGILGVICNTDICDIEKWHERGKGSICGAPPGVDIHRGFAFLAIIKILETWTSFRYIYIELIWLAATVQTSSLHFSSNMFSPKAQDLNTHDW